MDSADAARVDGAVLRRAQRGDHGAFHEIVDHYEGRLRVLAYHLLRDADQMNDALQDTFVKAWSGLPGFRGDAALGTWLHQICYRICLDYLRRQKVRPAGEQLADDLADPTDDVGGLALREQVSAALGRLPVEQRAVLLLVDREGYDYGTVAEALEVPVGTVASRLSLARAAMRRALRPETRRGGAAMTALARRPARPGALRAPAGERGRTAAEAGLPRRARGPAPGASGRPGHAPSRRAAGALTTRRLLAAASVAAAAAIFAFAVLPALRGGDTATAGDVLAAMTAASGGAQTVRLHIVSTDRRHRHGGDAPEDRSTDETDLTLSIAGDSLALLESTSSLDGRRRRLAFNELLAHHQLRPDAPRGAVVPDREARAEGHDHPEAGMADGLDRRRRQRRERTRASRRTCAPRSPRRTRRCRWKRRPTSAGPPGAGVFTVREQWGMDGEIPMVFHWDATVDQATGLLVAASCRIEVKGKPPPVGSGPPRHQPRARPGAGAGLAAAGGARTQDVTIVDDGTRFGTPEEVATLSWPTLPLIPQWAPAGYRLTDVASAGSRHRHPPPSVRRAAEPRRRGQAREGTPRSSPTVRLLVRFRRGFGSFVVQISPKTLGETVSGEPDVILSAGYLKGQPAVFGDDASDGTQIGISAPTLITYSDRSKVVITGDLTRGRAGRGRRVHEGLRRRGQATDARLRELAAATVGREALRAGCLHAPRASGIRPKRCDAPRPIG